MKMRTSSSQEEGADRQFAVMTQKFEGKDGQVKKLHCVEIDAKFQPIEGTEFTLKADLILLAMGFLGPTKEGMVENLKLDLDARENVKASLADFRTSHEKVWSAGDMRRGQSLVVWAIREGRNCAHEVDKTLMGHTNLPR